MLGFLIIYGFYCQLHVKWDWLLRTILPRAKDRISQHYFDLLRYGLRRHSCQRLNDVIIDRDDDVMNTSFTIRLSNRFPIPKSWVLKVWQMTSPPRSVGSFMKNHIIDSWKSTCVLVWSLAKHREIFAESLAPMHNAVYNNEWRNYNKKWNQRLID